MESIMDSIVDSLFSVFATLGEYAGTDAMFYFYERPLTCVFPQELFLS